MASSNPTSSSKPTLELITSVIRMVETLSVMRTISRFCTTSPIPAAISSNSIFIALSPGSARRRCRPLVERQLQESQIQPLAKFGAHLLHAPHLAELERRCS